MAFPVLPSVNDWHKKSKQHPDRVVEKYLRAIYDAQTIYERFDGLIKLLHHCDKHEKDHENYTRLKKTVLEVIGYIINDDNAETIREKITARIAIRDFDPFFMPWLRPAPGDVSNDPWAFYERVREKSAEQIKAHFKKFYAKLKASKDLLPYGGKDAGDEAFYALRSGVGTVYHSKEELEEFRVIPNKTNLLKLQTLDKGDNRHLTFSYATTEHLSIKAYDSFRQHPEDFPNTAIYTVHVNGGMFMGPALAPERTSFFSSEAILHPTYADYYSDANLFMAGQIKVIDGKIIMVDGASGHFMPDYEQTSRALSFFGGLGIINNLTELPYYRPTKDGDERIYTPMKCTWLMAMLSDYSLLNKVDFRALNLTYLKEHAPELYTVYQLQSNINEELARWLEQSTVFYNRPSPYTLKLNNAVEVFSKFGKYDQPEFTLQLLTNLEVCIDEWNTFHKESTSRRQSAVDMLEVRVMEQILYYKLYLLLQNSSYSRDPTPYNTIIDNFLQRKVDFKMLIEQAKPLLGRQGPQFFSGKSAGSGDVEEDVLRVIIKSEKTSTAVELKEIIRQLDAIAATSLALGSSSSLNSSPSPDTNSLS
ncbi:hypothetical protein [Legionella feeleii]|uniref:Uncharacterized protein n=1 Tax=Legionella feeleii TaxID=453 RepID=A0A0W0U8M0_9GAMM|nr:hypothetical protein [Legionella feeleii]KTD04323.1 hypothetical protein Lfee_0150 [Legionella feeleii]SPX62882.1 Uncharacterised protein [Legionella feeleii]